MIPLALAILAHQPAVPPVDATALTVLAVRNADARVHELTDLVLESLSGGSTGSPGTEEQAAFQRDRVLSVLRSMRDPSLKPLFAMLAAGQEPMLRLHGILGLADLDPARRMDLLALRRIGDSSGRAQVLGYAVRESLLGPADLTDVSRWTDLDQTTRVLVLWQLTKSGRPVDISQAAELADSDQLATRVFATLLYRHLAGSTAPVLHPVRGPALEEVLAMPARDRDAVLMVLFGFLRSVRSAGSADFVSRALERDDLAPLTRFEAVWTMLTVAPADPRASQAFVALWTGDSDSASRVRLAMAVLEAALAWRQEENSRDGSQTDPSPGAAAVRSALESVSVSSDPLLKSLAAAGNSVLASFPPVIEPIDALLAEGHPASVRWVLRLADDLASASPAVAEHIRVGIMDVGLRHGADQVGLYELVVNAAASTADANPEAIGPVLRRAIAAGDVPGVTALLTGVLRSPNPACTTLCDIPPLDRPLGAASAPGVDTISSLATLIRARHGAPRLDEDFSVLASIAVQQRSLPTALRVEAAWLALRRVGLEHEAIARIMAGVVPRTIPGR